MMEEAEAVCRAPDALSAEPGSPSGAESQPSEQPLSLPEAVASLAQAINEQNILLGQVVAQNADLISMLVDDEEDEVERDLSGKPIR